MPAIFKPDDGGQTHAGEGVTLKSYCGASLTRSRRLMRGRVECPTCAAIASVAPKFQFALIDPPWRWKARSAKGEGRSPKYLRQDLEWLKRLDVPGILAKDAYVGLWVIDPMLPHAFELAEAWGLKYSSVLFYWAKTIITYPDKSYEPHPMPVLKWHMGNGYGTRANPEQCWLFKRGKGLPRMDKGVRRLIVAPVQEHSRKPNEAYFGCEKLWGNVSRIDIFARRQMPGWAVWGDQVESSISIPMRKK